MPVHCTAAHQRVRHYGHQEVVLSFSRYVRNGRPCLRLMSVQDGVETGICAVCTVNLPHIPMRDGEVAVRFIGGRENPIDDDDILERDVVRVVDSDPDVGVAGTGAVS